MIGLGIDLGTTNTVLALNGETLRLSGASPLLPSVVAFPPSGNLLVGTSARRRRALDPKNTVIASKRLIGRKPTSRETADFQEQHPALQLVEADDGGVAFQTRAGVHTPVDIGAAVVSTACELALLEPEQIVATVTAPAHFRDEHRHATAEAIRAVGVNSVVVIDEPMAVATAYSLTMQKSGLAAVYDLGGGTFDFSLIDCSKEPFDVLATEGDLFLGGDDIDHALATWASKEILEAHGWDLRADPTTFVSLIMECERAKIRLTYAEETRLELAQVDPAAPPGLMLRLDRRILGNAANRQVQRTFQICDEVLRKVNRQAHEIDSVFMAGGSALIPMVWSGLREYFGKIPRCDYAPMEVVAIGASVAANLGS